MKAKIGLIPGLVREDMQADTFATLRRLAGLGYKGVEGSAVLVGGAEENRRKREEIGMAAVSLGANVEKLTGGLDSLLADANAAGAEHIILWHRPCKTRDDVLADAEMFNRVGERCAAAGVRFCYHNHDHEFRNAFDGDRAIDLLLAETNPDHVGFELDVGWVLYGGEDPVAFLRRHAGRFPAVHLKDVADLAERGRFTAVGTGELDVRGVIAAGLETGVNWFVVEQDRVNNLTGWESVTASILNLRELGLA